jgi:hypothetical protein
VKFKFFAILTPVILLPLVSFAQESGMTVVDEVIAQVNDDVVNLSMLKRETTERI